MNQPPPTVIRDFRSDLDQPLELQPGLAGWSCGGISALSRPTTGLMDGRFIGDGLYLRCD